MKKIFLTVFVLLTYATTIYPTQFSVTNRTGQTIYVTAGKVGRINQQPDNVILISDGVTTWKVGLIEDFKQYEIVRYELHKDGDKLIAKVTTCKKPAPSKTDMAVKLLSYISLKKNI